VTAAKPNHRAARTLLLQHLDMHPGRTVESDLDPAEVGIVGDTAHADGGDSYHLGADQIRARNGRDRYSVDESTRDKRGLDNYASAMDIGWFRVTTQRGTFDLRDFSSWLVDLCRAGDPDTRDLREVIYSPDGQVVRRWDRLGRRVSGDSSHLSHTHLSEHRDADGHRMLRLATRWLQHIGMIPEEDTMTPDQLLDALETPRGQALLAKAAGRGVHNQVLGKGPETIGQDLQGDDAVLAARFDKLEAAVAEVKALVAGEPQG
jgi:hypothetical protein